MLRAGSCEHIAMTHCELLEMGICEQGSYRCGVALVTAVRQHSKRMHARTRTHARV